MSCGCKSAELKVIANFKIDLRQKQFGEWTVLKELGHGLVLCVCSCGKESTIQKGALLNGSTKSCGHATNAFIDLTGKQFGEWTVTEELGYGYIRCKCSCGKENIIQKQTLLHSKSKSCGCKQYNNFKITAISRYGEVTANKFVKPREKWQIDAVQSRENIIELIANKFEYQPTIYELSELLGINKASVGRMIKRFEIEDYVSIRPLFSQKETELLRYIQSIYNGQIEQSNREVLEGKELDIYLPDMKLAIEFNGSYWHSEIYKDRKYHQNKTLECLRKNIRLIHIFEYEYDNEIKIKQFLSNIILNKTAIYARDTEVKEVEKSEATRFFNTYHIQGNVGSEIAIGLYKDNELVSVIKSINMK